MLYLYRNGNKVKIVSKVVIRKSIWSMGTGLTFHWPIHDEAHIFVFKRPRREAMTMFFVFFAIDMLFLDENKKVLQVISSARPFRNYMPKVKSKYVIEVKSGLSQSLQIKAGDRLLFLE